MNRRSFMQQILAAGVAPAVIGSGVLMPVRELILPQERGDIRVIWKRAPDPYKDNMYCVWYDCLVQGPAGVARRCTGVRASGSELSSHIHSKMVRELLRSLRPGESIVPNGRTAHPEMGYSFIPASALS